MSLFRKVKKMYHRQNKVQYPDLSTKTNFVVLIINRDSHSTFEF